MQPIPKNVFQSKIHKRDLDRSHFTNEPGVQEEQ